MAAVTVHSDFEGQENKISHCFHFSPSYLPWTDGIGCHELIGCDAMISVFFNAEFQASLFTLFFDPHEEALYSSSHFLPWEWYHLHIWGCWYFSQQSCFCYWESKELVAPSQSMLFCLILILIIKPINSYFFWSVVTGCLSLEKTEAICLAITSPYCVLLISVFKLCHTR